MKRVYTAEATAYGARVGAVVSSDERLEVELSRPRAIGGDDGPGTNPEQLFAGGYAACFHSAMRFAVAEQGLPRDALQDSHVTATVHLLRGEPNELGLAVELAFSAPRLTDEQAMAVMKRTHQICPYSRATAGNVEVELRVAEEA